MKFRITTQVEVIVLRWRVRITNPESHITVLANSLYIILDSTMTIKTVEE
jgi:hypothetical protein